MHKFKLPVVLGRSGSYFIMAGLAFVEGDVDEHKMPSHKT